MAKKWDNAQATQRINAIANHLACDLYYTAHAKERMAERGISTGDVMQILKRGYVFGDTEPATRGRYKYSIEGRTPNNPRTVRLIVLAKRPRNIKIITAMWKDEK